jgi:EAL domain-containing protein (putative c-di-GMP-specific phosphodiesterase class I)
MTTGEAKVEMVPPASELPRILLVEDEEAVRRVLARALSSSYRVVAVGSAEEAVNEVRGEPFDAVVSDVNLDGMSGVELLRRVREQDLDLPFVLMTGAPSVEHAAHAVEHGALRYLIKPVDLGELRNALATAVSMRRLAAARRQFQEILGHEAHGAADRAGLDTVVDGGLASLRVAWQPIVSWPRRRVVGYEALMRSRLPTPEALLDAAMRAGRAADLGRAMRAATAEAGRLAPVTDLYANIHPHDLLDECLYDPAAPLSRIASRVVLEVTERASLDSVPALKEKLAKLRRLGYRIALDDLGAGYAGLASFALLEPEVVKIDVALVRDVHRSATRRRLIASLLGACRDLNASCIAEGVQLPGERDALADLGCELFQGFLFARPDFAFPEPQW